MRNVCVDLCAIRLSNCGKVVFGCFFGKVWGLNFRYGRNVFIEKSTAKYIVKSFYLEGYFMNHCFCID